MNLPDYIPTDLSLYVQWSSIATVVFFCLTVLAFIVGWGFRFRLVGVTSFMGVITLSIFALKLGIFTRVEIPGATRYTLVYDNGANQAVVVVSPEIEESAIEPTLRQAAVDLFSYGRSGLNQGNKLTIKLRTIIHPQANMSQPLYLGQIKRSLAAKDDENMEVEIFSQNIAKLPRIEDS
ncbi:MAG: Ycf51 family protein [Xenococcaceae cyanobacterium]